MEPFGLTALATALLPAAADAIRGAVGWFTGGAGARPQNVGEVIQLIDAETRKFQALQAADGTHSRGIAVDIAISGADALRLLDLALELGFTGVGVQQKGEGRFLHLDTRDTLALWSY